MHIGTWMYLAVGYLAEEEAVDYLVEEEAVEEEVVEELMSPDAVPMNQKEEKRYCLPYYASWFFSGLYNLGKFCLLLMSEQN